MRKMAKTEKASKAISDISLEVDRLGGRVSAFEMVIKKGGKVAEKDLAKVIELLMNELIKLDGIVAEGDVKLQRKMQVKRVQNYMEALDVLKMKNSIANGQQKQSSSQRLATIQKRRQEQKPTQSLMDMGKKKKSVNALSIAKGCEVEVTSEKEMFKVSWHIAILQQSPMKVKGAKLRVCYTTLLDKDSLTPYTEKVDQSLIRPVQPGDLNNDFVYERGSVVDVYVNGGWWKCVIVKEFPNEKFLVYLDFLPEVLKFDKSRLRPNVDWTGSTWVKSQKKELSEDIYSPGEKVEMTRRIRKIEDIWVTTMAIKQIEEDGKRKVIIKRLSESLRLSDDDEDDALFKKVDICKLRPCPPRYFWGKYILGDIVEVFVSCGWRLGEVREVLPGNQYSVHFKNAKEEAVFKSYSLRPSREWKNCRWILTREIESVEETHSSKSKNDLMNTEEDLMNDARTPTIVLESNEDDMMNDDATEIITPEESYSNTSVLETTENETQIFELELRLSHESGDTVNDVASSIIDHQEIPKDDHEEDLMNDAPTPTIATRESSSSTLVLESNEDDMMNDDATEIITPQGSYSNTPVLEATENETQIFELELPLSHESGDTVNDVASPIIDHQEIPTGETMSTSDDKIVLPKRVIEAGTEVRFLDRITKRSNLKLVDKVKKFLGPEFRKLEDSFLGPIIEMGRRQKNMVFSRHLIHLLLLRRIDIGDKDLWFSFGEQPMRFSLREFHLATGLPCIADIDEEQVETSGRKKKKKKDPRMNKEQTLNSLVKLLEKNSKEFTDDQRLRLGASILVEGILMAINPVTRIPVENLLRARDFKEFCNYPWGNLAFNFLRNEVKGISSEVLKKDQFDICGFIYAVQLWALSSVDQIGTFFGIRDNEIKFPLCLHWVETKSLTMKEVTRFDNSEKVDVKCILGDPEIHCDLVEDVDIEFGKFIDLVRRGYRLKRQDWLNGSVNITVAEAEVEKNNYDGWIDATDKEKIEFLTKQAEFYKEKAGYLEGLLNIRRENEKENGQNSERELGEKETFQSFIDSRKQQNTKVGELNENASKESVLVKKKKRARETKEAEASTSKTKKTKTIWGSS